MTGEAHQYAPTSVPETILHEAKSFWNQLQAIPQLPEMEATFTMGGFFGVFFVCSFCFCPLSWFLLGKTLFSDGFSVISLGFPWFSSGKHYFFTDSVSFP